MIEFLLPLKPFAKLGKVCIDNGAFRLHYRLTLVLLIACTVVLSSKQFFGDPIHCINNGDMGDNKDVINSFCWIYGTYTLRGNMNKPALPGLTVAYAGVRPEEARDELIRHKYYQWVALVLFGQAVLFYVPRQLWKQWEGGRVKALTCGLDYPVMPQGWSDTRLKQILAYFNQTSNYVHMEYALKYAFCELLNCANVIGQIFLMDYFLDGAFRDYGEALSTFTRVEVSPLEFGAEHPVGPLDEFFPKVTKCRMNSYGPSGSLQNKDRLCVLPLNVVNTKIFAVLWFWYLALASVSCLALVFRIAVILLSQLRTLILMSDLKSYANNYALANIGKRYGFGGWFIIHLLGKNMNPIVYSQVVRELTDCECENKTEYKSNLYGNLSEMHSELHKV